jgi:hypothetical protein
MTGMGGWWITLSWIIGLRARWDSLIGLSSDMLYSTSDASPYNNYFSLTLCST